MRRLRAVLIATWLGAHVFLVADARAQTVEPVSEPSTPTAPKKDQAPVNAQPPSAAPSTPSQGQAPTGRAKPPARKPDKAALDEAKRTYSAGEAAYKAGDYKSAIENFRAAQDILPTPQAGYWLALSLKGAGHVPEAIAELKTLLASPSSDKLGPEKLATANAALDELNKTPGTVALSTEPAGATVSVDGEVRPGASPLNVDLSPGAHTITISMQGYHSTELELEVPPGSKGEQKVSLTALPPPPPPVAGVAAVPIAQSPRVVVHATGDVAAKQSKLGTYVVFGLAGAGAVVGTIFGIRALNDKKEFERNPSDAAADKAERDATISDIGFGAAITLGLAGLVMATVTEGLPTGREKDAKNSPARPAFSLSPYVNRPGGGASAVWRF
jgi:PEGA domain-containing protein